jgi:hypothetical protein
VAQANPRTDEEEGAVVGDLRRLLQLGTPLPDRAAARVTRHLRLLRAHGVIKKIPKTHRYRLTHTGRLLTAALFAVRAAPLEQLVETASARFVA